MMFGVRSIDWIGEIVVWICEKGGMVEIVCFDVIEDSSIVVMVVYMVECFGGFDGMFVNMVELM